jgi:hypothetical protein
LRGVCPIGLEDADRPGGADPMAVQEDHDLSDDLLLGPGRPIAEALSRRAGLAVRPVAE